MQFNRSREGGWAYCREQATAVVGKDSRQAKAMIAANVAASKVAATALLMAIEMLEDHPLLRIEAAPSTYAQAHPTPQRRAGTARSGGARALTWSSYIR
jgi:hypothetical protein